VIYRYRWIYVILLVFLIFCSAYYFDIKNIIQEQEHLTFKAAYLQRERKIRLESEKILQSTATQSAHDNNDINEISRLIDESELQLDGITNLTGQSDSSSGAVYKVTLRGDYNQLLKYLTLIGGRESEYKIKDFSFAIDESNLILTSLLILYESRNGDEFVPSTSGFYLATNPFCGADQISGADKKASQQFSVNEMRLIGTATVAGKLAAVILLPNGVVFSIQRNDLLGSEGGKVIAINEGSVTLSMPDHIFSARELHFLRGAATQKLILHK
jgi:hypothetical protein